MRARPLVLRVVCDEAGTRAGLDVRIRNTVAGLPGKDIGTKSLPCSVRERPEFLYKFALIFAGLVLGLVVGEVALRLVGFSSPSFEIVDRDRGWALRPGAQGWYLKEGHAYVRINSRGLRDREHSKIKPPRTIRIAVLGDSFTEARQVPMEQDFASVMERVINRRCGSLGGRHAEVLNFGVIGYGTAQELITLREHVWSYSPDIVVLAFFTGNDVQDNWPVGSLSRLRPFFLPRGGKLVLDDSFRDSPAFRRQQRWDLRLRHWLFNHVRVFQAMQRLIQIGETTKHMDTDPNRWWRFEPPPANYRPPTGRNPTEAWEVTEQLIERMHRAVEARGAKFLLVTLSVGIQVYPDPKVRADYMKRNGITDLLYPDHRLAAFAHAHGINVLTLAEPLQSYADGHHVFLHGFTNTALGVGHWNALGHQVAGRLIADRVCEMLSEKSDAETRATATTSAGLRASK
jgi:hypothetical protein